MYRITEQLKVTHRRMWKIILWSTWCKTLIISRVHKAYSESIMDKGNTMQYVKWINSDGMPNSPLQLNNSALLQFQCLQMLYTHFTQGKLETCRSHQPVSLFLSQRTKKTLPNEITIQSMTVPLQLYDSKCRSTLCTYLSEVWSNSFLYHETGIPKNTRWNLFHFNVISSFVSPSFFA